MGDNDDVTATGDRTSRRRRAGDRAEAPARFRANCRTLADAIAKTGTRLRIALTADTGSEPFLIHASYDIGSRMHRDIDLDDAKVLIDRLKLTCTREIPADRRGRVRGPRR